MSKIKLLTVIGLCGLTLAACGEDSSSKEGETSNTTNTEEMTSAKDTSSKEDAATDKKTGKRSNPYSVGDKAEMAISYYNEEDEEINGLANITINKITLGQEAQDFLANENEFNEEAPEGYQWAVLDTTADLIEGSEDDQLALLFTEEVFDPSGASVDQMQVMAFSNNQLSDQSLFPGASATGDITLLVPEDLDGTLMKMSYIGGGDNIWFEIK